jgi:hypothetical protein
MEVNGALRVRWLRRRTRTYLSWIRKADTDLQKYRLFKIKSFAIPESHFALYWLVSN